MRGMVRFLFYSAMLAVCFLVSGCAGSTLSEAEQQAMTEDYMAIGRDPKTKAGADLGELSKATTVRVDNGKTLTTDGPFAETKEYLGGFYLIDADNLDEAIEVAAKIPAARTGGTIEVRPVVEH